MGAQGDCSPFMQFNTILILTDPFPRTGETRLTLRIRRRLPHDPKTGILQSYHLLGCALALMNVCNAYLTLATLLSPATSCRVGGMHKKSVCKYSSAVHLPRWHAASSTDLTCSSLISYVGITAPGRGSILWVSSGAHLTGCLFITAFWIAR